MEQEQGKHIAEALRHFGLDPELPAKALNGGTANKNFVVRDEDGRAYILRQRSAKYSGSDWIDYEERYLLHIGERGLPVPVPLAAPDGSRRCTIGAAVYQLLPYMGGQPFAMAANEQLAEAGAFLGRLHKAADGFAPAAAKTLPRYDDPAATAATLARVLAERSGMEAGTLRTITYMLDWAERIRQRVPDEAYNSLPHTIVHGDFHPANAAFQDGRVSALYDFDWISSQPRLRDIADLLIYFGAKRPEPIDGGSIYSLVQGCTFDEARTELALQAYMNSAGEPLSREEAYALPELMAARLLYSRVQALAKVPEDRAIGVLTEQVEETLAWLERRGDWFADQAAAAE
jgi:homoserine kinase type II